MSERPTKFLLDEDRIRHWIERGAQPSHTVKRLMRIKGIAAMRDRIGFGKAEKSDNVNTPTTPGRAAAAATACEPGTTKARIPSRTLRPFSSTGKD